MFGGNIIGKFSLRGSEITSNFLSFPSSLTLAGAKMVEESFGMVPVSVKDWWQSKIVFV